MDRILPPQLLGPLYGGLTDESVWTLFRDRADPTALRIVLDRLGPRLIARCRTITDDPQLAEDALQDTLIGLYRTRSRLRTYPEAVAWMYRTATNAARLIARSRRRARLREQIAAIRRSEAAPESIDPEFARIVSNAVIDLPENERRAIELVYFETMNHADAAAALGWSRGSVGTYLARGLRRLQGTLAKCGFAAATIPLVEAGLTAAPPAWTGDRSRMLFEVFASAPTATAGVKLSGLALGLACATVAGIGIAGVAGRPHNRPTASPTPAIHPDNRESLENRNLRLFHADVLPLLMAQLREILPPDNPARLVSAHAFGGRIECEFTTEKRFVPTARGPSSVRVRYCVLRRRLDIEADVLGTGEWKHVNPERPIIFDLAIPNVPLPALDLGVERVRTARAAFHRIPADDRAEREFIRHMFGDTTHDLILPAHVRSLSGSHQQLMVVLNDDAMFSRTAGGWRYRGECRGWFLTIAGDRLFCDRDGIRSRLIHDDRSEWTAWCERPPEDWKTHWATDMIACNGTLYFTVRDVRNAVSVWSKPLADACAPWVRSEWPSVAPGMIASAGETLYAISRDDRQLLKHIPGTTGDRWDRVGRLPDGTDCLWGLGDRLVAMNRRDGPIFERLTNGHEWSIIGRVQDPVRGR
jgi:RNA polymerase sigma factor (sigma-70 family)